MSEHKKAEEILIVDDTPANLSVLSMMLSKAGYKVRPAISGEIALRAVEADLPDLILLDIRMPEMDGFEVCRRLKADPRTHDIPVIFISALSEIDDKLAAFNVGGVDYITKPFQTAEVRVRVNTHLTLARQRKEIAQLNQLKDQLIDTVTHNLKTPISMVLFYSDMLKVGKYKSIQETAEHIYGAGRRMEALINGFLDLNRIESGLVFNKKAVDLNQLLQNAVDEFLYHAERKMIRLNFIKPAESVEIETDADYLKEAVDNLVSNALKYTPQDGLVRVELVSFADHIEIRVEDTGIGIPPEYLKDVFKRFFRVPEQRHAEISGTGLGLAITAAIVEQLGGEIHLHSVPTEGSRFTILLPYQSNL